MSWSDVEIAQILADITDVADKFFEHTGVFPDTLVAPYGHYLDMVNCIASSDHSTIIVEPHPDDSEGWRIYDAKMET
jgi:hypothetical protein